MIEPMFAVQLGIVAVMVSLLIVAACLEIRHRCRRARDARRNPHTLFQDAHQCMAHNHWQRAQERTKARAHADTVPVIDAEGRL